jgi:hypothetical protein
VWCSSVESNPIRVLGYFDLGFVVKLGEKTERRDMVCGIAIECKRLVGELIWWWRFRWFKNRGLNRDYCSMFI